MAEKLTTIEFAEAVGLTDIRIRQMITRNELPAEKKGRDWLIDAKFVTTVLNRPERRGRPKKERKAA
jgi:excisionase family DNA binding protein